jgi:hypothetical protein
MGAMKKLQFQLDLAFFGLTSEIAPQFRMNLFTQIHEIVFWGNGGYDWETIYNMPIWLRKFTFTKLREHYENQNKQNDNDLITQTQKIKDGKIDLPPQFKGKLDNIKKAAKY